MNCSLFLKNLEKHFCNLTYKKKTSPNTLKIYRNIYRKSLSAIIYRLPILLQEIEIYRLSVSPRAFLKISIIVIALVQKGSSCLSLIKCNSGASTVLHQPSIVVIFTKQAHSLSKIFGRWTAPNSVRFMDLRFYVIAKPKYMEPI